MRKARVAEALSASLVLLFFSGLVSCSTPSPTQRTTGYAYVGPGSLNLRKDLGPRAPLVDTVSHGERMEVLETRRRFAKVRSPRGIEGWADSGLLLTQRQMDDLDNLAKQTAKLPSQGKATVYDILNVHTDPSRPSPSFTQIPEGGKVDVLAHRVTLHDAARSAAKAAPRRSPDANKKPKESKAKEAPVPPPPAPKPPPDWVERSVPRAAELLSAKSSMPPAAVPGDDWNLVRLADGHVGWVLSRMLVMQIPDEVAQYGEGHRITAYIPLGEVVEKDSKERHFNWLWATSTGNLHSYEFDSLRVFVWSIRRHRYETAFIERNMKGYYPLEPVKLPDRDDQGFSVVVEEKDGSLYRRTYAFSGYHLRVVGKEPYERPALLPEVSEVHTFDAEPGPDPASASPGFFARIRSWF